jgi:hypothetical protein
MRGERKGAEIPCSADGRIAGCLPLRLSLWRREGGGAVDLCPRLVDSRVRLPIGAGRVVVAAAMWNKVAGASSPSRRGLVWRIREASGFWCPQIRRSGGRWCSGRGHRREDGDLPVEFLFPVPLFVAVGCALAFLRRIWGRCVLAPAVLAGCCGRLLRSEPGSGGGSPVKTLKTAASPSTRLPYWRPFGLSAVGSRLAAPSGVTASSC